MSWLGYSSENLLYVASNSLTIAGLLISGFGGGLKSGNQTILDTFGGSS